VGIGDLSGIWELLITVKVCIRQRKDTNLGPSRLEEVLSALDEGGVLFSVVL